MRLLRINRNIVECKLIRSEAFCASSSELIETLWNVNFGFDCKIISSRTRINRNIVECKFDIEDLTEEKLEGINRNIVECK